MYAWPIKHSLRPHAPPEEGRDPPGHSRSGTPEEGWPCVTARFEFWLCDCSNTLPELNFHIQKNRYNNASTQAFI